MTKIVGDILDSLTDIKRIYPNLKELVKDALLIEGHFNTEMRSSDPHEVILYLTDENLIVTLQITQHLLKYHV